MGLPATPIQSQSSRNGLPKDGVGLAAWIGSWFLAFHAILGELLFLDPVEMGEGVSRDGRIPHRYRIHWVALGSLVLLGLAAQFLPVRRDEGDSGESTA